MANVVVVDGKVVVDDDFCLIIHEAYTLQTTHTLGCIILWRYSRNDII